MAKTPRRDFLKSAALGMAGFATDAFTARFPFGSAPFLKNKKISNRVIVLGMDGMDPELVRRFVAEGEMPTFKRCMEKWHFGKLQTTMPPQSPVAWSSFITGTNPGGHGIFDFIHRDPKSFTPHLSTSRSYGSSSTLDFGDWSIPLKSGKVELLRRGRALWSVLEEQGISGSVFQIPGNFPITEGSTPQISGMGTPDLLGTYGTCTLFTEADVTLERKSEGVRVQKVQAVDHIIKATLSGPKNAFRSGEEKTQIEFTVYRDPIDPIIKIDIAGQEIILKQGEWSEWIPLKFEFVPMFASVAGMVRLLVKQVHPHFQLYASPINVDPMEPSLPICTPAEYSRELTEAVGRFYTQGLPADTKALSRGVLSDDEYLAQAKIVLLENLKMFDYQLSNFHEGLFFFYFSNIDQNSHMLMRTMDPTHPLYRPDASPEVKNGVRYFYKAMDRVLNKALGKVDSSTTLIALSDHGFAPFRREFHLSTWLVDNGFTVLTRNDRLEEADFYSVVDWSKTRAYALGINGIYINLKGREKRGSVTAEQVGAIKTEIIAKLSGVIDPANGQPVIKQIYDSQKLYSGPFVGVAPDLVVGYQSGYRISDEAVLGKFPKGIVGDRTDKWAADHCLDHSIVPGILLTNKPCISDWPGLWDMAPSILKTFGVETPREMDGKPVLEV